jgi:hypothetical protein
MPVVGVEFKMPKRLSLFCVFLISEFRLWAKVVSVLFYGHKDLTNKKVCEIVSLNQGHVVGLLSSWHLE